MKKYLQHLSWSVLQRIQLADQLFLARPGCVITVDLSGNSITQISKSLWSGELRQMAKNVVSNCVTYNHQGIGGFETYGIEKTGLYMAKTVPVTNGISQ